MKANLKIEFSENENQKSENIEIEIKVNYKKNELYEFIDALVQNDKFERGFKKMLADNIRKFEEENNVEYNYIEDKIDGKITKGIRGLMNDIMKNKNKQHDDLEDMPF